MTYFPPPPPPPPPTKKTEQFYKRSKSLSQFQTILDYKYTNRFDIKPDLNSPIHLGIIGNTPLMAASFARRLLCKKARSLGLIAGLLAWKIEALFPYGRVCREYFKVANVNLFSARRICSSDFSLCRYRLSRQQKHRANKFAWGRLFKAGLA